MIFSNEPEGAANRLGKTPRLAATFALVAAMLATALLAFTALPSTSQAAQPSGGLTTLFQADPTQSLPTAQTDVTNQEGGSEGEQPLQGGSTDNNPRDPNNTNVNSGGDNVTSEQSGSTQGGNAAGNTGGAGGTGGGFPWWLLVAGVAVILVAVPFVRRRPINEPASSKPAADQERRDER